MEHWQSCGGNISNVLCFLETWAYCVGVAWMIKGGQSPYSSHMLILTPSSSLYGFRWLYTASITLRLEEEHMKTWCALLLNSKHPSKDQHRVGSVSDSAPPVRSLLCMCDSGPVRGYSKCACLKWHDMKGWYKVSSPNSKKFLFFSKTHTVHTENIHLLLMMDKKHVCFLFF